MPFLLDGNPTNSEISEAVNYLLGNFPVGNTVNPDTGQVVKPGGEVYGYIYKYMAVKYADSYDGSVGFSNTPTNKAYYGLRNSDTSAESSNPADYVWYQATGGFGTLKLLWYIATGGRQIQFAVSTSAPDAGWVQDSGSSIDLDVVTSGNIPVIAETFVGFFAPSVLQVPRSGNPLAPVFTGVIAKLYATDGGVIIPFVDAQTDTAVSFVNNTWRIGNSSTTGNADISYTNITVGAPTDGGDFAEWPAPTAMSSSPAYISVPIRYKNSLGVVTQASVASIQYLFADPGASGQNSPYIDISGYTGFSVNSGGAFSPANTTLTAITTAVTSPTYAWTITNATPTSSTNSSVVVTPNASVGSVVATLQVSGTNLASPLTKTITMPVVYQGQPGQAGANGVMSAFPEIYIWTANSTPPSRPTTTSTYTWATGAYTAPTGWSTTSPSNTTPGSFLWSITVPLNTSATTTTSTVDWTDVNYPIRAIAYNGTNGNNGNNASLLTLASTAQTFTYGRDGSASPASQTITFTANLQNLTGTVAFTATSYDSSGNVLGNPSLGGTGNTRTLTVANFDVAAYCMVSASLSGYSDQVTIIRLQDGLNTTSGYLTNESVTVQASSAGVVPSGGFSNAGGTFQVYNGTTDVTTSSTFSVVSSSGVTISIGASTGIYTVSAMSADQGTATLQAVYGTVTLTKVYSIAKSKAGSSASVLTLTQTAQTFTYNGAGTAVPTAQTILFTANTVNLSPTVGTPVNFTGTLYNSAGGNLGAATFTNVGVTSAELTIANFGVANYCVVTASFSGYSDQTTIYRLSSGTNGTNGTSPIVGLLTNETTTVAADNSGTVPSGGFDNAGGTFKVYQGTTDVTTSSTFSVASSSGVTIAINASTGVYTVSAMSANYGTATLQAVYGSVTIQKVYTIAKSLAGAGGTPGAAGSATFLVTRAANDSSAPTNAEVTAVIGRNPVAGDIATVSYNNANNAVVYRYTTTWISQATYITGSLIVENTITAANIAANTITGTQINGTTLNVLGTVTAGELKLGSNPEISGTTMTGTGAHLYSDGRMVLGNATNNINWNGSALTISGDIVGYGNLNGTAIGQVIAGSFNFVTKTTTGSGTFVVPAYVYKLKVTCIGGGGGAGGANYGGGGGGAGCIKVFTVTPGASYTYFVGAGGSAGANGQDTTFTGTGVSMTAGKGFAGAYVNGGAGGTATGGDLNISGQSGGNGTLDPYGGSAPFIGTGGSYNGGSASPNSGGGGAAFSGSGGSGLIIIEY